MRDLDFYITLTGYSSQNLGYDDYINIHCYVKYEALTKITFKFSSSLCKKYNFPEEEDVFLDSVIRDTDIIQIENEITQEDVAEKYGLEIDTESDIIFEYGFATSILWRQYLDVKEFEFPDNLTLATINEYIIKLRSFQHSDKMFVKIKDGLLCYIYLYKHYIIKPDSKSEDDDLLRRQKKQLKDQLIAEISDSIRARYIQILEESKLDLILSLEPLIKNICYHETRLLRNKILKLEQELNELKIKSQNN